MRQRRELIFAFSHDELFFHNLNVLAAFQVVKLIWSLSRDRGEGGWNRQWVLAWLRAPASSALSRWSAVQLLMTDHRWIPSTQPVSSLSSEL